jgi:hypothetical protein
MTRSRACDGPAPHSIPGKAVETAEVLSLIADANAGQETEMSDEFFDAITRQSNGNG